MPKTRNTPALFLTVLSAILAVVVGVPQAAYADPDDEGGSKDMREQLDEAIRNYNDARDALNDSKDRQVQLEKDIEQGQADVESLTAQVNDIARGMYEGGTLSQATVFLTSENPEQTIDGMVLVSFLGDQSARKVTELKNAKGDLEADAALLESTINDQKEFLGKMEEERGKAARAIAAHGGDATTGPTTSDAPKPVPAVRNPNGSLPGEGCSQKDPTSKGGGCLTPRTLHALQETEAAGWTRYVACYRGGSWGEHPQGRACDFSVTPHGFSGEASGEAKAYGDNLAGWYVQNADALGVLYVIWYRKIWMPGQGWVTYDGAGGEPNSDHTNHVHLSVR
ncbi:hypothetical protein Afil01_49900 [Actinorhabdospora filicis]|uniref:ARB-07466-like C-terminal domain-containing protein n=1 Tax=Actinorhabdospora filicis TaxID=1785913 RepID=A0A9W6WBL0_9ACTN|nr:hypothetical protein [Actinorhabdospora filicis]GLZ80183.1 hypothetical protein Afil01_49900 [Actinorhabdospora filicis]